MRKLPRADRATLTTTVTWQKAVLGDVCTLYGGGTPSRKVPAYFKGSIPWATPTDVTALNSIEISVTTDKITEEALARSSARLLPPRCVLLTSRATIGSVAINTVPMCTNQGFANFECGPMLNEWFLAYYFMGKRDVLLSRAGGSIYKEITKTTLRQMEILLPPLPVQGQIVQILQKADEIRRKRQEALELAGAILSASFISMFGDPSRNHNDFRRIPLGDLADVRSGVTKGRKLKGKETVEVPYLRVANVQDGFLDLTEIKTIEVLPQDIEKYHLEDGDILMTEGGDPDKLGRGSVWRNQIEGCIHQNHVFRVRTNRSKLDPEYLAALLRTQYAKHYFLSCAKRTSNLASVNSTQVKAFPVPLPPISLQNKFVSAVNQWEQASERLTSAETDAEHLFLSLMNEAFTGDLTAEWEAENQEWIAEQVKFHEQLPQLILLALLQEKASREGGKKEKAALLVTALMKYVFLLQMEGSARRRFYQFVPYHYGPFAKELYTDLESLQTAGLVNVDNETDEDKTRITVIDPDKVVNALADIPEDRKDDMAAIREDIASILDSYGDLDHKALLKTVYEKYPAYAKKSRLKKRRAKSKSEN